MKTTRDLTVLSVILDDNAGSSCSGSGAALFNGFYFSRAGTKALAAQSAEFDGISGATITSDAFKEAGFCVREDECHPEMF